MSSSNLVRIGYKKESSIGTTPAAVKASKVLGDITWTAVKGGEQGNLFSIEYLDTVAAGSETVTISAKKITVAMDDGASTATQILAAVTTAAAALAALGVGAAITGTAGSAQAAAVVSFFTGGSGSFRTTRFVSEQYSGSPDTTESAQIRTDRLSSGQVVTSLKVEGGHNFELAKERAIEDFMESAMFSAWAQSSQKSATMTINVGAQSIARSAGSFIDDGVLVGDFLSLGSFADAENNTIIMVMELAASYIRYAGPTTMKSVSNDAATFKVCDKLTIGTTKKPLTIEKAFTDLTTKALIYRGCMVSQMDLSVEYGALVTGSFQTMGTDYDQADAASEFASYLEYFDDAATTNTLNGSVDMPFLATNVTGTWAQDAFCLQSLSLSLNNNFTEQHCIGTAAPEDYSAGTAQISVDLSSYLRDGTWGMFAKKLAQTPFALGFQVSNTDGWYGFYIPALQISFDDPQSAGANQEVSMEMSGVAKVGSNGESSLTIFKAPS